MSVIFFIVTSTSIFRSKSYHLAIYLFQAKGLNPNLDTRLIYCFIKFISRLFKGCCGAYFIFIQILMEYIRITASDLGLQCCLCPTRRRLCLYELTEPSRENHNVTLSTIFISKFVNTLRFTLLDSYFTQQTPH